MDQFESFETKRFVQRLLGKVGTCRLGVQGAQCCLQTALGSWHASEDPFCCGSGPYLTMTHCRAVLAAPHRAT